MSVSYWTLALAAALAALLAWIRLAPDDPARWHVALTDATTPPATGPCAEAVQVVPGGARAAYHLPGTPEEVLARLDTIALAAPRTTRLAGAPGEGRITWVQRSFLMGYPDYVTAEARPAPEGTRLDVLSRQRYGTGDWGVNAARLADWLSRL